MHTTDTGIQVSDTMQHKHMGYVLWRALVTLLHPAIITCELITVAINIPASGFPVEFKNEDKRKPVNIPKSIGLNLSS